jgi:FtsH-binding integral membrane protein
MPSQPITLADRLGGVGSSVLMAVFVLVIAKIVHFLIASKSKRKWIHGEPICWWSSGMCLLGSVCGVITATNGFLMYKTAGILGAMGMAIGIFIGLLHGGRRVDEFFPLTPIPKPQSGENDDVV